MTDFARDGADISIRWGSGPWPGVTCIPLIPVDFAPMLSPQLAESIGGIRHPADLLRLPIIGSSDPWWKIWFAEAGIDDPDLEPTASTTSASRTSTRARRSRARASPS